MKIFNVARMKEMDSIPSVSISINKIPIFFVYTLFICTEEEGKIEEPKKKLDKGLLMKDPGKPGPFLELELSLAEDTVYLSQESLT